MKTKKQSKVLSIITLIVLVSMILVPTGQIRAQDFQPPALLVPFDGEITTGSGGNAAQGLLLRSTTAGSVWQNGADRLVEFQNPDGGFQWQVIDPPGASPTNIIGPTAQGLAESFYHTIDPDHMAALKNAGIFLLSEGGTPGKFSPSAGYLAATLDAVFGGSTYKDFVIANYYAPLAAGTYVRASTGLTYDTAGYVAAIRAERQSQGLANMATWDVGMGLVGAASVGADTAPWVAGVEAEINELSMTPPYYHASGLGAALYGLSLAGATFDPTAGPYASASSLQDLGDDLASLQISTGGFTWYADSTEPTYLDPDMEAAQETAYAMLGLNQLDRARYLPVIQKASNYLASTQLGTGGWLPYASYTTDPVNFGENNEITGEALWAMSVSDGGYPISDIWVCPVADGDCGHPGASSHSIQAAIDAVGHSTIYIAAGTYDEQVIVDKGVTLIGAGDTTIIKPSQTTANGFTLFDRKSGGSANVAAIMVTNTTETVNIQNLKVDGSLITTAIPGAEGLIGILYRGNPGLVDTVTVTSIDVGNDKGLGILIDGYTTPVTVTINNSTISGYSKNGITALYTNMHAVITGNTITGKGPSSGIAQNGIQIAYGADATISGNTISGHVWTSTYGGTNNPASDLAADGSTAILLYMSGAGVEIKNNILTANQFAIWTVAAVDVYIHNNTITGLAHTGSAFPTGIAIWSADMWTVELGGTEQATNATISNNTFSTHDYSVLVRDYTAGGPVPTVTLSGNTYDKSVTVTHLGVLQPNVYSKIQDGYTAAVVGDTVNVGAGTYDEDLTINKSISLIGAGADTTTIRGVIGGGSATIQVGASNVTIAGFTITRLGNTVADWNLALNSAGVAIANPPNTGIVVRDNIIIHNRTGIDINNSSGNTVTNNHITDNRTGMVFRNQTDNMIVTGNEITNNWTLGIVFLDASGGTNSPVQSALNSTFSHNNLSGNWYGQVVERQAGGSLPTPGTTNLKNFAINWWGTLTPVVSTAASGEPDYSVQIPLEFGGSASAPGGKPDIMGSASANIVYDPWCTESSCNTIPQLPSSFYGFIHYYTGSPSGNVDAFVPGITPAVRSAAIVTDPETLDLGFQIDVPGDVLGTSSKEGGASGDTVTFMIGGRVMATKPWLSGTNVRLDFHPPEAVPGDPYYGLVNALISFSGSANDWGGSVGSKYDWDWNIDGTYDTLNNATPTHSWPAVGDYTIRLRVTDSQGGVGTATTTVHIASITLGSLSQTYDGSPKAASATTDPADLTVNFSYSPINPPVNVGSYTVTATIPTYTGSVTGTLVIGKATSTTTVTCPASQTYTGFPITPCTAAYSGAGGLSGTLPVTYGNNVNVGTATANATYGGDSNHFSSSDSKTFGITAASATITLGNLNPVYDGLSHAVTVTTTPPGLAVSVTYDDGSGPTSTPPSAAGAYTVIATITDPNFSGSATATMHILKTYSLTLVPGWNLVSFNLVPVDPAIGTVLNNIAGKYDLVYAWDGTLTIKPPSTWLKYAPGGPPYANDLLNLTEKMGFWIHVTSTTNTVLNINGNAPTTTNITLSSAGGGWNLVGFPKVSGSLVSTPLAAALTSHNVSTFTLIYAYHAYDTPDLWKLFDKSAPGFANDLKFLEPGWGYWIQVSGSDQTWHVEYPNP